VDEHRRLAGAAQLQQPLGDRDLQPVLEVIRQTREVAQQAAGNVHAAGAGGEQLELPPVGVRPFRCPVDRSLEQLHGRVVAARVLHGQPAPGQQQLDVGVLAQCLQQQDPGVVGPALDLQAPDRLGGDRPRPHGQQLLGDAAGVGAAARLGVGLEQLAHAGQEPLGGGQPLQPRG
jgi:hypothetical protein